MIPNVYLTGRVKSINGIFRKMFLQGKTLEEIYDVYAVRVIVDSVADCYNVLGVIHDMFQPIPNRFKDYIGTPKPNRYQSLHTTVIGREGIPFEVQIRTWEMHYTAEYGIAAHWKYKLGLGSGRGDSMDERLAWVRQMLEEQKETGDATDIIRTIKSDLVPEEVFVFTPKGKVISLPAGSTVIDFAYAIHSAVGNRMVGAKVDKRIVPLDTKVHTGEIIEILTSKDESRGPSRDWLNIVKTSEARNKIRQWFKKEKREENIQEGRAQLERELKRNGMDMTDDLVKMMLEMVGRHKSCTTRRRHVRRHRLRRHPAVEGDAPGAGRMAAPAQNRRPRRNRRPSGQPRKSFGYPAPPEKGGQRRADRGHGQLPREILPVLQPAARGRHHRLYHQRVRGVDPQAQLHQRARRLDPVPGTGTLGTRPVGKAM